MGPRTARGAVEDARRLLGDCILFRGLGVEDRKAVVEDVRIRTFAVGETIFLMGSPGDSMMAVLSGTVRISVASPEGRERFFREARAVKRGQDSFFGFAVFCRSIVSKNES